MAHQLSFPRTFNLVIRRSVPISSGERGGEGRGQREKKAALFRRHDDDGGDGDGVRVT